MRRRRPEDHSTGASRRSVLQAAGTSLLVAPVVSCDLLSTAPSGEKSDAAKGDGPEDRGSRNPPEAPMLAEQVRAGSLPAVEDRLPKEPLVIQPTDSIGKYGGTWHSWMQGLGATYVFDVEVGYDPLVRWDPGWKKVIPNVAKSWRIEKDGRAYTFQLRRGMRWSDGKPFTADDLLFTYEDILTDTDISPVPSTVIAPGGVPGTMKAVGDYEVRITFDTTNGLFLNDLANGGSNLLIRPKHYLKRFHKKYAPDAGKLAEDQGYSDWVELFGSKNDFQNPDLPVINAWRVSKPVAEHTERGEYVRNAYYWKVDPEGSQLPYLDRVYYPLIPKAEAALLKTMHGEIDFNHPAYTGGVTLLRNKPVLARNRKQGGYGFVDSIYETMNWMVIGLNLNHKDSRMREMFQNRDFRIGLSYAIDRAEIRDKVYQRQGEAWQAAPRKESRFFDREFAKQYTEHDVAKANEYLDRAGYSKRDVDGFRLRGDGKRVGFTVEVATEQPDQISSLEVVKAGWTEVGVDVAVRTEPRTLFSDRIRSGANLHDVAVWTGDGGYGDEITAPVWYLPTVWCFASRWADWYNSDGKEGERPNAPARQQLKLYDQLKASVDEKERDRLFGQILRIAREQFWCIGTVLSTGAYGTVKGTFKNVPDFVPAAWNYPSPGPTRPEQYFTTKI